MPAVDRTTNASYVVAAFERAARAIDPETVRCVYVHRYEATLRAPGEAKANALRGAYFAEPDDESDLAAFAP